MIKKISRKRNIEKNIFSLKNKVAIVTGASRGLGKAIALGFLDSGAKVVLASRDIEKNKKYYGKNSLLINTDVTKNEDLMNLINQTMSKFKKIDILVNCAGFTKGKISQNYSETDWKQTMDTNLNSIFQLCKIVGTKMIKLKNGGSIINITSIASVLASPKNPAYNASKGGLSLLTKALAADWAKHNIRVNNLGPGYFNTELNKNSWNNQRKRKIRSNRTLMKRWGEPNEIIGPAIFLASNASSYVTGQDIYVDGGFLIKSL